jgi:hypothetical protein
MKEASEEIKVQVSIYQEKCNQYNNLYKIKVEEIESELNLIPEDTDEETKLAAYNLCMQKIGLAKSELDSLCWNAWLEVGKTNA